MKSTPFALLLPLALASCASLQPVPRDPTQCPKPPPVDAWILEPEPSLLLKMDKLFSISAPVPPASTQSLPPAKQP